VAELTSPVSVLKMGEVTVAIGILRVSNYLFRVCFVMYNRQIRDLGIPRDFNMLMPYRCLDLPGILVCPRHIN
jgi:hypothetical protein